MTTIKELKALQKKAKAVTDGVADIEAQILQHEQNVEEKQAERNTLKSDSTGDPVALAEKMADCERAITVASNAIEILKSRLCELIPQAPGFYKSVKSAVQEINLDISGKNETTVENFYKSEEVQKALATIKAARLFHPHMEVEKWLVVAGYDDVSESGIDRPSLEEKKDADDTLSALGRLVSPKYEDYGSPENYMDYL